MDRVNRVEPKAVRTPLSRKIFEKKIKRLEMRLVMIGDDLDDQRVSLLGNAFSEFSAFANEQKKVRSNNNSP